VRADFLKNHSNSIVVVKEPCSGGSDDESVLILDVYEISGLVPLKEEGMSEEEKQAIIDFMKSKKGKTKHYFNELCKAVPHMKMRAAKKVINEMVNDGQLKYWSSGSTTLYLLPEHADVSKEEEGMN